MKISRPRRRHTDRALEIEKCAAVCSNVFDLIVIQMFQMFENFFLIKSSISFYLVYFSHLRAHSEGFMDVVFKLFIVRYTFN